MKKKVKVGLVQIGDSFGDKQFYFPYSVGVLQAYAQKYLHDASLYEFMNPIYRRMPVATSIDILRRADIVFFSSYLWNFRINLHIAAKVKAVNPALSIVFGGPQVPEKAIRLESFLRYYPFIDSGCYGEGEVAFLKVLEHFSESKWENVPSLGYINRDGSFIQNPPAERIRHLDDIPSPYLEGVFENLIKENPDVSWSAMWETNRGCPFSCTFCTWGAADKKAVYHFGQDRLFKEIDWFSNKKIEFVFCCDANVGLFERDLDILKKVAENKLRFGYPQVFSVQSTKKSTNKIFELQKILNDAGLQKGVNLALQSLNPATLKSIKRTNVKGDIYKRLQRMFTEAGIHTFTDIIIGLPMETYGTLTDGISSLIEDGQHNRIQFINLAVLENSAMADPEYQKRYGLVLEESKIIQHHSSLQEEEDISETQMLVVGTDAMPKEKWINSRIFCWMTSLLHFDKLLQIPFMLLNKTCSIRYKELIEAFFIDSLKYPCLSDIYMALRQKAVAIQKGEPEHVPSKELLNLWWPIDEYLFIKLCMGDHLSTFYEEAERLLADLLIKKNIEYPDGLLHESIDLNYNLIKKPFASDNLDISLQYNCYDVYRGGLVGIDVSVEKDCYNYRVERLRERWDSWDTWLRDVIWYGTKKGAFIYSLSESQQTKKQRSGHSM